MLSCFRVDDAGAEQVRRWAERLGVDRSELLRDALRRQVLRLASEDDAVRWADQPSTTVNACSSLSPTEDRPRTGRTGRMQRGEIWFAAAPGGDRPVLVLTRDPVADRTGAVVVAALTRTHRGLESELELSPGRDGVRTDCIVNFDNLHTLPRKALAAATGC